MKTAGTSAARFAASRMASYAGHTLVGRLLRRRQSSRFQAITRFASSLANRYSRLHRFASRWGRFLWREGRRGAAYGRRPWLAMALARRRLIAFPDQAWLAEGRGSPASSAPTARERRQVLPGALAAMVSQQAQTALPRYEIGASPGRMALAFRHSPLRAIPPARGETIVGQFPGSWRTQPLASIRQRTDATLRPVRLSGELPRPSAERRAARPRGGDTPRAVAAAQQPVTRTALAAAMQAGERARERQPLALVPSHAQISHEWTASLRTALAIAAYEKSFGFITEPARRWLTQPHVLAAVLGDSRLGALVFRLLRAPTKAAPGGGAAPRAARHETRTHAREERRILPEQAIGDRRVFESVGRYREALQVLFAARWQASARRRFLSPFATAGAILPDFGFRERPEVARQRLGALSLWPERERMGTLARRAAGFARRILGTLSFPLARLAEYARVASRQLRPAYRPGGAVKEGPPDELFRRGFAQARSEPLRRAERAQRSRAASLLTARPPSGSLSAYRFASRFVGAGRHAGMAIGGEQPRFAAEARRAHEEARRGRRAASAETLWGLFGEQPGFRHLEARARDRKAFGEREPGERFRERSLTLREPGRSGTLAMPAELYEEISRPGPAPARLDYEVRMRLAPFLGFDPGIARLHSGPTAARAARSLRAQAFAIGHDIFFGEGRFEMRSPEGLALIAHELAHVGQQTRARSAELRYFTPQGGDTMEAEAQQVGARVQAQARRGLTRKAAEHKSEDLLHSEATPPKPSMPFAMPAPAPGAESMPEPSKTATQEHEAKGSGGKQAPSSRGADAPAIADRIYDLMREEIRLGRQRGVARFAT